MMRTIKQLILITGNSYPLHFPPGNQPTDDFTPFVIGFALVKEEGATAVEWITTRRFDRTIEVTDGYFPA